MSLEAALRGRSLSPASSGRSTPVPKASRRAEEDGAHRGDKTFRKYATTIERALSTWDISPEEWADYIAFLGRLLKAIQSHPKDVAVLPHSGSVASKLSQCMNPALPSGVHQKALEVYAYIFSTFGRNFVRDHLDEFFPGLSAVLSFASLSVRPALYDILEEHIVPLSPSDLRPLLKAVILSLLPALEEETSEDFERAFRILESFERKFATPSESASVGNEKNGFFWQCLFLAVNTSPLRRQGALNYLAHKLPRFERTAYRSSDNAGKETDDTANGPLTDAEMVISPEPGLLIRAFVCGLSDPQLLIQRGFLDLLVTHLPLDSNLLQTRIRTEDLDRLVTAAMHVLLRREMSLNRRLWSWFLGPEPNSDGSGSPPSSPTIQRGDNECKGTRMHLNYFLTFGKPALERSVLSMFTKDYSQAADRARPFRLCLSLMDRWEIGGSIVPEMFLPAIESVYKYSLRGSVTDTTDLIRSASLFFDSIEASLIWSTILSLIDSAFKQPLEGITRLRLCNWIIQHFNINDEEMVTTHIPRCALFILSCLGTMKDLEGIEDLKSCSLDISSNLLDIVPERALPLASYDNASMPAFVKDASTARNAVLSSYHRPSSPDGQVTVIRFGAVASALYNAILSLALQSLQQGREAELERASNMLLTLHGKCPNVEVFRSTGFLQEVIATLSQRIGDSEMMAFSTTASLVNLVTRLKATTATESLISENIVLQLNSVLTPQLWLHLSPGRPKHHVEATRVLWQIHELAPSGCHLEAALTTLIHESSKQATDPSGGAAEAARRFGVLWAHSISAQTQNAQQGPPGSLRRASTMPALEIKQSSARLDALTGPLMLILDLLSNPQTSSHATVKSWLHVLPSLDQIFRIHFALIDDCQKSFSEAVGSKGAAAERDRSSNIRDLEYSMDHILAILKYGNDWTWECLDDLYLQLEGPDNTTAALAYLVNRCTHCICDDRHASPLLEKNAIEIVELCLSSPDTTSLKDLDLDTRLIDRILFLLARPDSGPQSALLKLVLNTLKLRLSSEGTDGGADRPRSRTSLNSKRPSTVAFKPSVSSSGTLSIPAPPNKLLELLRTGFSTTTSRLYIDQWLEFLSQVLPIFSDAIFSGLIPLVECLCRELDRAHGELVAASQSGTSPTAATPETAVMALLEALEMVLARAHRCLAEEQQAEPEIRANTQSRGLLANMTSGVFKTEGPPSKTAQANSRLTVILTFQDAIRVSLKLWIWGSHSTDVERFDRNSAATTSYNALRIRNRTRHLLEQIFAVEPLESLEVVMSKWCFEDDRKRAAASLNLLHVLPATRPKNVIPAILDALCSRTNPSALPPDRLSTQSTELKPLEVAVFFSAYLQSTEDDAMDEIWMDCMAFLRDVLANPLPYRQVLPALLLTLLLLAQKIENTNFGEQRKMRKELGDSFNRLLTAAFTTMPSGYIQNPESSEDHLPRSENSYNAIVRGSTSLIAALKDITMDIEVILETPDRVAGAMNGISSSLIGPMFRAKSFPKNIKPDTLGLLLQISKKAPSAKTWRKELLDAFNDPRLLSSNTETMKTHWFPVLAQWCLQDKERVPELLGRLAPPSSAGIMFGVGANAARLEADRRTQLNLRRLSLLLLACAEDSFAMHMRVFNEKLAELFEATVASSPSAAVKSELFMLCRALVLSTSSVQLSPMWPIINENLHAALASLLPNATNEAAFGNLALLQACKLLDLLMTLSPDEFQLHEWLYVTDTIDAVYQPINWDPAALSDQIANAMASEGMEEGSNLVPPTPVVNAQSGQRRPLLDSTSMSSRDDIKAMAREDFTHTVLQPFLSQLSMYAYEAVYGMNTPDLIACRQSLLDDLLDLLTIVE